MFIYVIISHLKSVDILYWRQTLILYKNEKERHGVGIVAGAVLLIKSELEDW